MRLILLWQNILGRYRLRRDTVEAFGSAVRSRPGRHILKDTDTGSYLMAEWVLLLDEVSILYADGRSRSVTRLGRVVVFVDKSATCATREQFWATDEEVRAVTEQINRSHRDDQEVRP